MSQGRRRGIAWPLVSVALVMALAASLCSCSSLSAIKNPFKKEKVPLPGERIAVIAEDDASTIDRSGGKPIALPAPAANASWSQPGGVPANNPGNLVLADSLQKVWSADAGTGSSSKRTLERHPPCRRRQGLHSRRGRGRLGLLLGERRQAVVDQRDAGAREEPRGLRRRARARRWPALRRYGLWHGGRAQPRQRLRGVDQEDGRPHPQLAHGGCGQDLLRVVG